MRQWARSFLRIQLARSLHPGSTHLPMGEHTAVRLVRTSGHAQCSVLKGRSQRICCAVTDSEGSPQNPPPSPARGQRNHCRIRINGPQTFCQPQSKSGSDETRQNIRFTDDIHRNRVLMQGFHRHSPLWYKQVTHGASAKTPYRVKIRHTQSVFLSVSQNHAHTHARTFTHCSQLILSHKNDVEEQRHKK